MSSKKSIAQAAVPCPSRHPESESHEKPTTVYLFFHHPEGAVCHTFFSIDIPNPLPYPQTPADAKNLFEQPLSPILEFPLDEYPEKMCCLKFASKFYFIGGELFKESDPSDVFPPDVYIFDPTSTTDSSRPLLKKGVPMTTGKPSPVGFFADGKIYILGSSVRCNIMNPKSFLFDTTMEKSIKCFECFDPSINKWTVLEDPPISSPVIWLDCFVVRRKVFVYGYYPQGFPGIPVTRIFNLDNQKWTTPSPQVKSLNYAQVVNDTLYGLKRDGDDGELAKLGLFTEEGKEDENLFNHQLKIVSIPRINYPGLEHSKTICHLEGRQFCYVVAGSPPYRYDKLARCYLFEPAFDVDAQTRNLTISVLEEEIPEIDDSSCTAKFLYTANFVIKTSFSNVGPIKNCYALTHGEKKKKMKNDMKRKMKKKKKKNISENIR